MTDIPDGAKKPQDRKASVEALKAEAEGSTTVTVEVDGREFELPRDPADWKVRIGRAYDAGKQVEASALIFEDAGAEVDDWTNRQLADAFEAYARQIGLLPGE